MNKIASSNSKDGLEKLINQYFFSTAWVITEDLKAYNNKLDKYTGKIEFKRNKYTFYL